MYNWNGQAKDNMKTFRNLHRNANTRMETVGTKKVEMADGKTETVDVTERKKIASYVPFRKWVRKLKNIDTQSDKLLQIIAG